MGKCLLAYADDPAAAVAALPRLDRATERTITSPEALVDELERTRERGWALNDEERNPGVRAVAAPVLGVDGFAIAAVAVQGPAVRLTRKQLPGVAEQLATTTGRVAPLLAPASPSSSQG
jgi:IclR family acetate operon transcriptional repressor